MQQTDGFKRLTFSQPFRSRWQATDASRDFDRPLLYSDGIHVCTGFICSILIYKIYDYIANCSAYTQVHTLREVERRNVRIFRFYTKVQNCTKPALPAVATVYKIRYGLKSVWDFIHFCTLTSTKYSVVSIVVSRARLSSAIIAKTGTRHWESVIAGT